jgi:tripartite-type tricarboxylate transporter receptor subunit TctC
MRNLTRNFLIGLLAAGASIAAAQDYPSKPVRLIDPYVPGGSTGVVARAVSAKFQDITRQPMVVENKPGAGSNVGSELVARAPADGYTILLGTSSLAINPALYKNMGFDPQKDLAPVVTLIRTPNVLAVNAALPVHSVNELIAYARAHPGELNYGSSGNGATNHMGMELFKSLAHVDIVHVPFKGGGEALTALLGGQTQVMFNPASTLVPHAKSGRIRIIAVGSTKRIEGIDAPPVADTLPGFESGVWFGLFAPAGTPPAVIAKLNADINASLRDPQVLSILKNAGMEAVGGSADDLKATLVTDTTRWANVVKGANIRIE